VNQSRAALAAIAVVIPLAMIATVYTGRPAQQASSGQHELTVVASFYPLYEFASHVAGDRAKVSSLVPAGIEPHDWEPNPDQAAEARDADMVIINGAGFESWAGSIGAKEIVDTSEGMEFDHANPHVWLDPILAKHQVEKIRDAFVSADPENANYYIQNAASFTAELDSLDSSIRSGLADCEKSDFVAFHDAFAHFAKRYGLTQHSIQGVSPEGGVLPQKLQQVIELAKKLHISVIYSEDLVDSRLADTIAAEIPGGRVLVLSPIEGIGKEEQAAGIGYVDKMEENIANLKEGLACK
jgi:zinc transport system substrate-binding protein